MPAPDHRLYKSRLFNFLNRQSLRWRDRLTRTVQHLRVAVEWGTQTLIYPVYLLVQAGRTARQKLGQAFNQAALSPHTPQLPLSADRPVERVLQEIKRCLPSPEPSNNPSEVTENSKIGLDTLNNHKNKPKSAHWASIAAKLPQPVQLLFPSQKNSILNSPLLIQGIASQLESRCLVAVTQDNKTADIFSKAQQKHLQERIRLETANYWYERRLKRQNPGLIPTFSTNPDNVLPPVRGFWQVMRWIQTSPMAIALNLFGESSLVPAAVERSSRSLAQKNDNLAQGKDSTLDIAITHSSSSHVGKLRGIIQEAINYFFGSAAAAKLPDSQKALAIADPSNLLEKKPLNLLPSRQTLTKIAQTPPIQSLIKPLQQWGEKLGKQAKESLDPENCDPFQIQVLIYAAIDYFFGQSSSDSKLSQNSPSQVLEAQPHSLTLPQEAMDDPWLSWDDLYGETPEMRSHSRDDIPDSLSRKTAPLSLNPGRSLRKRLKRRIKLPSTRRPKAITTTKKMSKSVTQTPQGSPSLSQPQFNNNIDKISPDWVETEVTSTGYVKHPLVQVLEWLDVAIHWLEEWGVKLWRWGRKKVNNFFQ